MSVIELDRDGKPLTESYEDDLLESLQNPAVAKAYLNAALEDEDYRVFLLSLRDVAESFGISKIASTAGLNREHVYRILSENGNPRISSLMPLIRAVGLRLKADLGGPEQETPFLDSYTPLAPERSTESVATIYTLGFAPYYEGAQLPDPLPTYEPPSVVSIASHIRSRPALSMPVSELSLQQVSETPAQPGPGAAANQELALAA